MGAALPAHWSSREGTRATYDVAASVLRLRIPTGQGLWAPDRHTPALRTSTIASGLYAGPLGSTVGQQPFAEGLTVTEEQPPFRGWLVDGVPLRTSDQLPAYPLQLFVGVFDFPEREDGTTRDHEPSLEVDRITHEPL